MSLLCLLRLGHDYRAAARVGSGFERQVCARCGHVRAKVAPPLVQQVEKRLDRVPNPKYWTAGPGVSVIDQVGVSNRWLQRGYANEEMAPPPTTGSRSN